MIISIFGWLGAILLATCGIPQLIKTLKTKKFDGLSLIFIIWWLLGEVFILIYVLYDAFRWPLIFNYGINIFVCLTILLIYLLYSAKK